MMLAKLGVTIALAATFALAPILPLAEPAAAQQLTPDLSMPGGPSFGMMGLPGLSPLGGPSAMLRGCGSPRPTVPAAAISELPRATVEIYDGLYVPSSLTVRPGTVVVFHNRGSKPHTATAWDYWDSGVLQPGESCAIWSVTPGTYNFLSIVAADGGALTGSLTVGGDPLGGSMAPAGGPGMAPAPGSGASMGAGGGPGGPGPAPAPAGTYR